LFEENRKQLKRAIETFESMQMSTEELKIALKKQTDTFADVIEIIRLGIEGESKIQKSVHSIEGRLNGNTPSCYAAVQRG
jgi:hypothetical protein